ncbi:MAG: hypothetical protein JWM47_3244 [Acidimicrobiales bacterium]|nr:hypothetical protein [Acidimicrobiales bacterium]
MELSQLAISSLDTSSFFGSATGSIARGLAAPLVALIMPQGDRLVVKHGQGWKAGVVGSTIGDAGDLEALIALAERGADPDDPSEVGHLPLGREVLARHGAAFHLGSGVRAGGKPRGLLAAHLTAGEPTGPPTHGCPRPDGFSESDAGFLRTAAYVFGLAIEHREMLSELSLSRTQLTMLLDQMPALVWTTDRDLTLTFVAGSGLQLLEVTREELVGVDLRDFYAQNLPDGAAWTAEHLRALQGEATSLQQPFHLGTWNAKLHPLADGHGRVEGVVAVAVDTTEVTRAQQEAKERLHALERIDEERRRLLMELTDVTRLERERLSRDIHDVLGQLLTSASLYAASIEDAPPERAAANLAALRRLIGDALVALRGTVSSLREPPRAASDLAVAVERLTRGFPADHARIDLHSAGLTDPLPGPIAIAAYRIIQESVTNALKHAQASSVSVVMTQTSDRLTVVVEDDGAGFEPGARPDGGPGYGLIGMEERARDVGGLLTVVSAPGSGTTIRLEVDVPGEVER